MSDLPDLDTSQVSYISYWNVIDDGGVSSFDPSDVLTDGNIQEYTLYDNGIHIDRYSTGWREIQARVKSDGWFIAYLDRTNDPENEEIGPWEILDLSSNPDPSRLATETTIQSLQSNLSNSGNVTFNYSDVSLYNYEYPDASNLTIFFKANFGPSESNEFSYTSGTTIKEAYARADDGTMAIEGYELNNIRDLLADNIIPNADTFYAVENTSGTYDRGPDAYVMILWS